MPLPGWKPAVTYSALLAAALLVALAAAEIFGAPLNKWAYDGMFRVHQPAPWQPESAILAIDERTLADIPGDLRGLREPLARGLRLTNAAGPKAIAVDLILENQATPAADATLAEALASIPNVVLASQLLPDGWVDPRPEFRSTAIGHVHAPVDSDGITRAITLSKNYGQRRYWALALEAFRLGRHADIVEDPETLQVGNTTVPAAAPGRALRVRFLPHSMSIPEVTLRQLLEDPARASVFRGKVVFVGVTAQTEHDTVVTPYSNERPTPGVQFNAEVFETLAHGVFLTDLPVFWVLLLAGFWVAAEGLAFRYLQGWRAYAAGVAILGASMAAPSLFFTANRVLRFADSAFPGWLGFLTAGGYYHLVVRRRLGRSEAERTRYQQAMHFVTHEMRTPLSAIQGSSELISRYALTDEKRTQLSQLINSESKRLARMVEIFLNVERLSAGQMELKRESIPIAAMIDLCVSRTKPLADRKHIGIILSPIPPELQITGDRELMEYACYNLLTNAVKYSPQRTEVTVDATLESGHVRIAVRDQGIGMDQKEVKQIFRKFYRTKKAEESGEAGTGIGLSIVQQIVEQHGGKIEVMSQPGVGSCFTVVLPAAARTPSPAAAERH